MEATDLFIFIFETYFRCNYTTLPLMDPAFSILTTTRTLVAIACTLAVDCQLISCTTKIFSLINLSQLHCATSSPCHPKLKTSIKLSLPKMAL
jgi:hypothetical protein